MATIRNTKTGDEINLLVQHTFGRHSSCQVILSHPKASRNHATITWDGECWVIVDTSSNGTFVNNNRLQHKIERPLAIGDKVTFAMMDNDTWHIENLNPPQSLLMPETPGTQLIVLDNLAVLPDENTPTVTLYRSSTGDWICESPQGVSTLVNGDKVALDEHIWRFIEATGCAKTLDSSDAVPIDDSQIAVKFKVSQNEEHVELELSIANQNFNLGERTHHYLLLTLARQQAEDKKSGFSDGECGWIERSQLMKMLDMSEYHLNTQIYRLRKQLMQTLPNNNLVPTVIQRRKGQIRLGLRNFVIEGGFFNS